MLTERRAHTTLPTQDVDGLRAFYEGVLGFAPYEIRPGAMMYRAGAGTVLVLSRAGARASGAYTQMAFTVPDVEAEVRELRARGVTFEAYETPKTIDGVAQLPADQAAWFKDPDGNLLAIIELVAPD